LARSDPAAVIAQLNGDLLTLTDAIRIFELSAAGVASGDPAAKQNAAAYEFCANVSRVIRARLAAMREKFAAVIEARGATEQ
jgi:hypothetical protein